MGAALNNQATPFIQQAIMTETPVVTGRQRAAYFIFYPAIKQAGFRGKRITLHKESHCFRFLCCYGWQLFGKR